MCVCVCVCVQSLQSCLNLCNLVDCSLPVSSVLGILQARILEWVAMPSSRGSFQPKDPIRISCVSCIAGGFFTTEPHGKPVLWVLLLFSHVVMSDFWWAHGLQNARLPCPLPSLRACSNSCPLNWWCYPTISSSVISFPSCIHSFPASGFFLMSWLFTSGGQRIGALASESVLPMNIQDWFPSGLTGLISLQSKGLSRVFSNTTVQKHQFLVLSLLYCPTHICTWLLEKP